MKNLMDQRIKRIEDLLQNEVVTGMVAIKTGQGINWNGEIYNDDEGLHEAVKAICGRNLEYRPLVVIDLTHGGKDTQ